MSGPWFAWGKVVLGRSVTRLPKLSWASQLFIHYCPYKTCQTVCKRNKKLACDGRLTLLPGPTFLTINTLAHSVKARQLDACTSTVTSSWLGAKGSPFFNEYLLKLIWLGRTFLHINRNSNTVNSSQTSLQNAVFE